MQMKPWLKVAFMEHGSEINDIIKEVQRGTRLLQTICAEAKAKKMLNVARLVPGAKKILEGFLCQMKVVAVMTKQEAALWVGNLKHKDMQGNVVSSQEAASQQQQEAASQDASQDEEATEDEEAV